MHLYTLAGSDRAWGSCDCVGPRFSWVGLVWGGRTGFDQVVYTFRLDAVS
jgi:hypothetical protein